MTWQFCDDDACPDTWHWLDLAGNPEACRDTGAEKNREGVVGSIFAA